MHYVSRTSGDYGRAPSRFLQQMEWHHETGARMAFTDELNQRILDLWYRKEFGLAARRPRMPRVYSHLRQGGLLTVGLNPSFSAQAFKKFAPNIVPEELFGWRDDVGTFDLKLACEIDAAALTGYSDYYGPFWSLAAKLTELASAPVNWQHTDAFLLRIGTDDELAKAGVLRKGGRFELSNLTDFGRAQLEVCISIIEHVSPQMLVVANAKAARLIEERLGATFDDDRGEFSATISGKAVPVFFSAQLKYMDIYSSQILEWRIKRAFRRDVLAAII